MDNAVNQRSQRDDRFAALDQTYKASMNIAVARLRRLGAAAGGKRAGDRAPDFALGDRNGAHVSLFGLLRGGPVVLSFSRGEWCSFCCLEAEALLAAQPRIAALGGHLVMVSPQGPTATLLQRTRDLVGLTVLHDPLNGVGLGYGLVFRMPDALRRSCLATGVDLARVYGSDAWLLPIPATYVVARDGIIVLAHVDSDFSRRLDPGSILACLARLLQRG